MRLASVRLRHVALVAGLVAVLSPVLGATASNTASTSGGCAQQFELAQQTDMESFRDFDEETFRAIHHPDAVTVFASGAVRIGIDAIMAALAPHFANKNAVWSWTERYRLVDGCKSAYILYDTIYEIPSANFRQHALVGVSYTHKGNRWLGIADQGTLLP